jgi:hypothetical protein
MVISFNLFSKTWWKLPFLTIDVSHFFSCYLSQIRVNSVNPTVVMTELGKMAWSDPSRGDPMKARIPLGKFAGNFHFQLLLVNGFCGESLRL